MRTLALGQRYRKASSPSTLWEIVGRRSDEGGIAHVRLSSVSDRTRTVLISEWLMRTSDAYTDASA